MTVGGGELSSPRSPSGTWAPKDVVGWCSSHPGYSRDFLREEEEIPRGQKKAPVVTGAKLPWFSRVARACWRPYGGGAVGVGTVPLGGRIGREITAVPRRTKEPCL